MRFYKVMMKLEICKEMMKLEICKEMMKQQWAEKCPYR